MSNPNGLPILSFGSPATYRITVQGQLDTSWSERLAGMSVSCEKGHKGGARSHLVGLLRDQAELSGVLDTLHRLHMPIIRVEQVSDEFVTG